MFNAMLKVKRWVEQSVNLRPHMAASNDQEQPSGRIITEGVSPMTTYGNAVASGTLKNFIGMLLWQGYGAGKTRVPILHAETAPGTDAKYATLPYGTVIIQNTVSGSSITNSTIWTKTAEGYKSILTSGRNTIDTSCTTALGGSGWDVLRVKSKVPTGVTCAAQQSGVYIETEVTGTGVCSGVHYGLKIETYVEATATMSSDHYGIGVFTYSDIAGNQQIYPLRLEHNGASVAGAFIGLYAAAGKMQLLISSSTTNDTWMSVTTTPTCSGVGGWYKVKHGGYTRYIQLWTTVA